MYQRTYSRRDSGAPEKWEDTVDRAIRGNIRGHNVSSLEIERLRYFMLSRKAGPAGRGLWFSGTAAHVKLGGTALGNCWGLIADDWINFVVGQDLLMLGGGVGLSVEHRFVSKLPRVKRGVTITHQPTKDADFIVPDSREGWNELTRRILESFFVTGKGFTYSTICVRGYGEPIHGFGGTASGPRPLIAFVEKICAVLCAREGRSVRPIDAADMFCSVGEMVVMGNVRRSAIIIIGDAWDKEYLKAKRWDLGPLPSQRDKANWSVVCDDVEDLHPLFWRTYENGEPFGIVNRSNIQKYGRMGELKKDTAIVVNPCVPAGTEILTKTGYRTIESCVGETVEVWNGFEFSPVQPQKTGSNQKLVMVSLSSGQSLVCTPAHNFWIKDGYRDDPRFVRADELTIGMKLEKTAMPIIYSGRQVRDDEAYSQGFYSGDGTAGIKHVWLYGPKIKCAERMSGMLGNYLSTQDRQGFTFSCDLHNKNFVPNDWAISARLQWFAGLLDSDGTELKEGGAQIGSIDRNFLLAVQKMLTTLGSTSKISILHAAGDRPLPDGKGGHKNYACAASYRLLIGATQMQALREFGLSCTRLAFDKRPQRDASQFVVVTAVEELNEVASVVYCFKEGKRGLGCFEGIVTGQCAEATLENGEMCNLQEIALPSLNSEDEFVEAAKLMHRWGKRVALEKFHQPMCDTVIKRNMRVGTGITGCLASPLFTPGSLDLAYAAIQQENIEYAKELGVDPSIRTTVVKPSGTMSKVFDMHGYEGVHAAFSRYIIQRVRFGSNDPQIPLLLDAGHRMEPVIKLDGTLDHNTLVVDFYEQAPVGAPVANEDWSTWKQLDTMMLAQKHWADQAVSVTVYYDKKDITKLKEWLTDNLKNIKTISFLCQTDHGFRQAPKESITKAEYERFMSKLKPIDLSSLHETVSDELLQDVECAGGACPAR